MKIKHLVSRHFYMLNDGDDSLGAFRKNLFMVDLSSFLIGSAFDIS